MSSPAAAPHIPVLLDPILDLAAPVSGTWLDGTFGNGGYTRELLNAGADKVIAVDRDPAVFEMAATWAADFAGMEMVEGTFSKLDDYGQDLDGVVLDLGVSSMQIDQAERGFSFMQDGPLDMRMSQSGQSAADIIAEASEEVIADILFHYGEERASRRIARSIVAEREIAPITTTHQLVKIIEANLPRPKFNQSHPATRSFQALRIAVNDEYGELYQGLLAAERALKPGGILAVVTFHSVEDRMVKRFFQARAGKVKTNRYAPVTEAPAAQFEPMTRKAITASDEELAANPRSRSAKLRAGRRTTAPSIALDGSPQDAKALGQPQLPQRRR